MSKGLLCDVGIFLALVDHENYMIKKIRAHKLALGTRVGPRMQRP